MSWHPWRPWARALWTTARSGLVVERTSLRPLAALRGALGVALVLGLALRFGSTDLAVSSAFGAFAAGGATFHQSWRPRPLLALASTVTVSLATFVGYLCAAHVPLFLLLIALCSLVAGMAWAIGPVSGVIGSFTVAIMLIVVHFPTTVAGALFHAGLIAAGGLVQVLLATVFPDRPWGQRREVMADALAAVADYARRLRYDPMAPFDPEPLLQAHGAAGVTPRQARRLPRRLPGFRTMAERFRPVLASLADPVVGGAPMEGPERARVRELLEAAGTVLDATARGIRRDTPIRLPGRALEVLRVPEEGPVLNGPAYRAAMRLIELTEATVAAAHEPVRVSDLNLPDRAVHRPPLWEMAPVALRAVRSELHPDSPVTRHAVRLALVVPGALLLGRALPTGHGYWMALTVLMVLRPGFAETYERGVARFVGTLLGVTLAGLVLALAHPGAVGCAGLAVLCAGLNYLLKATGYALASFTIGGYVVFLLGIAGSDWDQTVPERIALTACGGVLAMLSYLLYPAWETPRLRDLLADWLAADGRYAVAVLQHYALPTDESAEAVREALLELRQARQEWEQAVERANAEPVRHRGLSQRLTTEAQSALVTLGRVTMLLEAHLPQDDTAPPSVDELEFATVLAEALARAAPAVRDGRPLDWSTVHHSLDDWRDRAGSPAPVALRTAELLASGLDELAAALAPVSESSG